MKHIYLLLLFITSFCFSQQPYYNNVNLTLTGLNLKNELATKIINTHTTFLTYSEAYQIIKNTDEDPNNPSNVILIYNSQSESKNNTLGGGNTSNPEVWNREHTYAKSLGTPNLGTSGPGSDVHHLRASNATVNSARGSLKFSNGSGSYKTVSGGWYPGDEWKGDVARMMMYMYLRYGNQCLPSNVGVGNSASTPDDMIDLFLDWNSEDPVSTIEEQRNTILETQQGNRNPFIDNPALATVIWGGTPAQDIWGNLLSTNEFASISYKMYPNPVKTDFVYFSATQDLNVIIYDVLGKQVLIENLTADKDFINVSNLNNGIYIVNINSSQGTTTKKLIKQ